MEQTIQKTYTPENILRKSKRDKRVSDERAQQILSKMSTPKKQRSELIQPETFVRWARTKAKTYQYMQKRVLSVINLQGKKAKRENTETPNGKLLLVVRIRGVNNISDEVTKIFNRFRIREINTAVFLELNKATLIQLKKIESYITYGIPTKKTIQELIYKKGHCKSGNTRKAINNNNIVEKELGSHGIICIEDLVHEIQNLGENFRTVNKFLCPFKLSTTEALTNDVKKPFKNGGQWGNREDKINELIFQMI